MKKLLALAISAYLAQGCVFATGLTEGIIADASAARPHVSDAMHASGGAAPQPSFGRRVPVPSNLPLPKSTNPAAYFRVPELGNGARSGILGSVDAILYACHALNIFDTNPSGCVPTTRNDGVTVRRKVLINR